MTDNPQTPAGGGRTGDDAYVEYVSAKVPWLRRVAYLMCQDWHRTDDLVQASITKLYTHWHRAQRVENLDAYVRAILVNTFLAEQRTSWWRRVVPTGLGGAGTDIGTGGPDVETGLDLAAALAALPPRQRAAVVLRHYCDLSVEETAELLSCSSGTIKSQTSRGLATLRASLTVAGA